ncbi:alpha/beta hydrolase [Jatrophihabitans sp.]|uniref:alpha/beta hydrolase n=1 Tax=Jatrophihabitans sp. TaxID=1932789 RepID=UPI0030C6AE0C|nr:esterase [Jatrophihabitans sp.]
MHLPRPLVVGLSGPLFRLTLNDKVPVSFQRGFGSASALLFAPPAGTQVEQITLGGRPAERISVGASERPRAVLYLHGGGYVMGTARMYRAMAAHLARTAGAVVYTLDYRLAPEHVYPAAVDDAEAAFVELVEVLGYPPERIAIAGDSAGGGLTVATARRLLDAGTRPGPLVLLSPWTDPADTDLPARDFVLTRAWGHQCAEQYRGDADPTDPGYAPMWARLDDLPPILVHYGAKEALREQIRRFVARAEAAGADIRAVELPTLWHSGHLQAGMLREATDAVRDIGLWLRPRLDSPRLDSSSVDSPRLASPRLGDGVDARLSSP